MRLYLVSVVVLSAVGGCALPVNRYMASQDHIAISSPRLAGGDRPPAEVRELDSFAAVENVATVYDFHATILHILGLDHERLSFYHNGIERRLTDVHGAVLTEILG